MDSASQNSVEASERPISLPVKRDSAQPAPAAPTQLLLWIVAALVAAHGPWLVISALGVNLSRGAGLALYSAAALGAVFLVIYRFLLPPLLHRLRQWERKSTDLEKRNLDLERLLSGRDSELAGARSQLQSESALRRQAEGTAQQLARELEQRVSERTARLQARIGELEAEAAQWQQRAAALKESEKHYRRLLETAHDGIWTITAQGKTQFINRRGAELLGYTASEMSDLPPEHIIVIEDLPAPLRPLDLHLHPAPQSLEFRMRHKDGRSLWVRASLTPVEGERGEYWGALVIFSDCSAQRAAQDRFQQQSALLDQAQDAVLFCDSDLRLLSWNQGAARLYGWTREEAVGKHALDLLADPSAPDPKATVLAALRQHGHWRGELAQVTKDGQPLTVDLQISVSEAVGTQAGAALLIATDLTPRRKREIRLLREARVEAAGTLAGGLAHQLNSALAPVLLSAQMLRSKHPGNEDRDLVASMEAGVDRCAEVVKQTLIATRGIQGERVPLNPARLIQDLIEIAREMLPCNLQIQSEFQDGLWSVKGDPVQLQQVLLKLCVNARDAMLAGGTLTFKARNVTLNERAADLPAGLAAGSYVVIEVQDTGTGIPEPIRDRVFEPFFTTKDRNKNAGLGLSVALGMVRSHGGSIEVQSRVGAGSTFSIYLPADVPSPAAVREASTERGGGQGELILVVDEDANLRELTKATLTQHGYEVLTAADGLEALDLLARQQGRVKLILTSFCAPHLDGPSLARAARRVDPQVGIIASSAWDGGATQPDKIAAFRSHGIGQVLAKPYRIPELLRAVREELNHRGSP